MLIKYNHKKLPNEVIYAVNNKVSGGKVLRDTMAEELLQVIEMCGQSIRLKYLLAYYLLEVELRRAECWVIAQQLMFESEMWPCSSSMLSTNVFEKSIQIVDATEDQVQIDDK